MRNRVSESHEDGQNRLHAHVYREKLCLKLGELWSRKDIVCDYASNEGLKDLRTEQSAITFRSC